MLRSPFQNNYHAVWRVYHPQLVAVYHHGEAVDIIKPQGDTKYTRARDEIQQRQTEVCLCW